MFFYFIITDEKLQIEDHNSECYNLFCNYKKGWNYNSKVLKRFLGFFLKQQKIKSLAKALNSKDYKNS